MYGSFCDEYALTGSAWSRGKSIQSEQKLRTLKRLNVSDLTGMLEGENQVRLNTRYARIRFVGQIGFGVWWILCGDYV